MAARKTIKVSGLKMAKILCGKKGACFIAIESLTEVPLNQTWRRGRVYKLATVNATINFDYTNSVNYQRKREAAPKGFNALSRHWGRQIRGTPFIEHEEKYYLYAKVEGAGGWIDPVYLLEGKPIDELEFNVHRKKRESKYIYCRQGVKKEILVRTFAFETIKAITVNGIKHVLAHGLRIKKIVKDSGKKEFLFS